MNLILDERMSAAFYPSIGLDAIREDVLAAKEQLLSRGGVGSGCLGWIDLPETFPDAEFDRIEAAATRIRAQSDAVVLIGVGGSYLGARAAIDFLNPQFGINGAVCEGPDIYFAGHQLSTAYLRKLTEALSDRDFSINVISKSGTTMESAIAFRYFRALLEEKYGPEEAAKRIYVTTDREKGALKAMADKYGYETFAVPDDVGGRYSVLTSVGFLPMAVAGIDIKAMMRGARAARENCLEAPYEENLALLYAGHRNLFYRAGKEIEILAHFEPSLRYFAGWWRQLFAESEGKEQRGIYPTTVSYSTDLHSIGQYIQDGNRIMMETFLEVMQDEEGILIREEASDEDELNYLAGKSLSYINHCAMEGAMRAHRDGGVPTIKLVIPDRTAEALGELFYFFEFSCAVSGYMLGVNPFDQPGVDSYKNNMFQILGRPGY